MWQIVIVLVIVAAIFGWLYRGYWVRRRAAVMLARAIGRFAAERHQLEVEFLQVASQLGKPRGLAWTRCDFVGEPMFAIDRANGDIHALQQVTIGFEAIAGGGMEEVEAVGNLRSGSAVFHWVAEQWTNQGRVVFNLPPQQAVQHFKHSLVPVVARGPETRPPAL